MARWNLGPKNGLWKGGRTVDPRGYVLVRVGESHHLADVRGYAYEHRLVAERILGRRLRKREIVHHKDEIKSNNKPWNIEVVRGGAEHRLRHRTFARGLRLPGERNRVVFCRCGCGKQFRKYDGSNRPRRYAVGHGPKRPSPTNDAILAVLEEGPSARLEIVRRTALHKRVVSVCLARLKRKGVVSQVRWGVWQKTQR